MVKIAIFGTMDGRQPLSTELSRHNGPREDGYEFPSACPSRQTTSSITQVYCPEGLVIKPPESLLRKHERPRKVPICKQIDFQTPDKSRFQTSIEPVMVSVTFDSLYTTKYVTTSQTCVDLESENFCASSDPSKRNSLCTGIDGPEPTAIHGARPTAGQFLRMA